MYESRIFNFNDQAHYDDFKAKAIEISQKDSTFRLTTNDSRKELYLQHEDLNVLHKKSLWTVNHLDPTGKVAYQTIKLPTQEEKQP